MTHWRLIIDAPADGAAHMAHDEALLEALAAGTAPPTLRLYRWAPACVSLGRFQRFSDIDGAACAAAGYDVVRRPSGGRALLHANDLTYALAVRADDAVFGGATSILATYQRISGALQAGLAALGVDVVLAPVARRAAASAACFAAPASYELTAGGRKLIGSAQARSGGALLQHGSLPLGPEATGLTAVLRAPTSNLGESMTSLADVLDRRWTVADVTDALISGVASTFGVALVPGPWTEPEQARAAELRATRYAHLPWLVQR